MVKNKGFWILFIPYLVLFVADLTTTLMNKHLIEFVELNPLYKLFGSLIPILLLNLAFIGFLYFMYKHPGSGPFNRYVLLLLMAVVIGMRIIAIHNAMTWYNAPAVSVEQIKEVYTTEVIVQSQIYYAALMYAPVLFCIALFFLYKLDHDSKRKDL